MIAPRIAVLGMWHQGVVAAGCLAELGFDVVAGDPDASVIAAMRAGKMPIFEPGLEALVNEQAAAGRLKYTEKLDDAVDGVDVVMIAFDTPVDDNDNSDLSGIFDAAKLVAPRLKGGAIVYVTAQVPIGTCARIGEILKATGAPAVSIAYSPENLQLGKALDRFRHPALPVIGTEDPGCFARLSGWLAPLSKDWRHTNLATAEMLKHALNAFLGISICFANELGNLCDAIGADGVEVGRLLRLEPRIGPRAFVMPGLGFSGGTLARDMTTLRALGDQVGVDTQLLDGAWRTNQEQNKLVLRRLTQLMPDLSRARICVLGLTYKPDTSTLRRSASLELIRDLMTEGAQIRAHDPAADRGELASYGRFDLASNPYAAAQEVDVLVLMTPWAEYKDIQFDRLRTVMRGKIVFDTARLWKPDVVRGAGFDYIDIGSGAWAHLAETKGA